MNIQRILVSLLLLISAESYCQESSTLGEIYNFEVGDEFQMLEFYYTDTREYIIKRKVITYKEIEMDKITYIQFNTNYDILGSNYPPFQLAFLEYYFDTLVINYPDSIIFSNTPPNSVYYDPNLYNGRKINRRWYYITNSTIIDIFADGCGLVEYHISEVGDDFLRDSLLYYKKGEETWGSDAILGTQEYINPPSKLFLYPNPVFSKLQIELENQTSVKGFELKIYNSSGKQVIQTKFYKNTFTIDCSKLNSGLYFIKIKSEKDQMTSKFIKR